MEGLLSKIENLGDRSDVVAAIENIQFDLDLSVVEKLNRYQSLDLHQIWDALRSFLTNVHIPHMTGSETCNFTFEAIGATTMEDDDDERPVIEDRHIFLRPRQFDLFRGTHEAEIKRWFKKNKLLDVRHTDYIYPGQPLPSYTFLFTVLKVSKNASKISFDIEIGLCYDKWFGDRACFGAISNLPTGDQVILEHVCKDKYVVSCRYCKNSRFCCSKHADFASTTVCKCQKNK